MMTSTWLLFTSDHVETINANTEDALLCRPDTNLSAYAGDAAAPLKVQVIWGAFSVCWSSSDIISCIICGICTYASTITSATTVSSTLVPEPLLSLGQFFRCYHLQWLLPCHLQTRALLNFPLRPPLHLLVIIWSPAFMMEHIDPKFLQMALFVILYLGLLLLSFPPLQKI